MRNLPQPLHSQKRAGYTAPPHAAPHLRLSLASLLVTLLVLAGCSLPAPPAAETTPAAPTPSAVAVSPTPSAIAASPTAILTAISNGATPTSGTTPVQGYRVLASYPHDANAFTQGLVLVGDTMYEGTGLYGESDIREVALATGEVRRERPISPAEFGEGITLVGERIVQITWREGAGHVYDLDTFEPIDGFGYPGEGWGITYDGTRLIMSDGTSTLRMLDPDDYAEVGRVEVRDENGPVTQINELEYVEGEVYANIWHSDRIARIDPQTGRVNAWIDMTGVAGADRPSDPEAVLNGIAYDPQQDRLVVTGKLWPKLYEIEIVATP